MIYFWFGLFGIMEEYVYIWLIYIRLYKCHNYRIASIKSIHKNKNNKYKYIINI